MNIKHSYALIPFAVLGAIGNAAAQQASTARTAVLDEVIVTAQKRSESLKEVPVAVSAFTSEKRDLVGITTVQDFTNFTPGITYSSSLDRMAIRGIGRQTNGLATSSSVSNYNDGFYNSSNHAADFPPLFIERVEILRGPQGTLYGRNSIGGAINVISKGPTEEFGGEARIQLANFDRKYVEGLLSGPITDSVSFLIGGYRHVQNEGYLENIAGTDEFGRENRTVGTAQLKIKIGDAADVRLKYTHSEWDNGYNLFGSSATPYQTNCPAVPPATSCGLLNPGTFRLMPSPLYNTGTGLNPANPQYTVPNPGVTNLRQVNHDPAGFENLMPDNSVSLEVIGHLGWADLKYVGGYHNYYYIENSDNDQTNRTSYTYTPPFNPLFGFTPPPTTVYTQYIFDYRETKRNWSNEINLLSTSDGPLQWIAGLYQYYEHFDQPQSFLSPLQSQLQTPFYPVPPFTTRAPDNPARAFIYNDSVFSGTSSAAFGQIDYKFADTWKATLGLRYTRDRKYGDEYGRLMSWDPTTLGNLATAFDVTGGVYTGAAYATSPVGPGIPTANGTYTRHLASESHATTGTAGIAWTPNKDTLGYLKYTRGYKDGGINAGSIAAFPYTDPEFVNALEAGWKQSIGGSFSTEVSVFYYDYQAAQIPLTGIGASGALVTQVFNIDAKNYGLELEATWKPIAALQLTLDYGYLKTKLHDPNGCYQDTLDAISVGPRPCTLPGTASVPGGPGQRIDGDVMPGSPENKIAFNALYTFDFQPGSLTLSGSYIWRDEQYSSIFTRDEWKVPSYGQADFRGTWTSRENKYSVIAFVRNAFDEDQSDGVAATTVGSSIVKQYTLAPPRQYGLELQYRFGAYAK